MSAILLRSADSQQRSRFQEKNPKQKTASGQRHYDIFRCLVLSWTTFGQGKSGAGSIFRPESRCAETPLHTIAAPPLSGEAFSPMCIDYQDVTMGLSFGFMTWALVFLLFGYYGMFVLVDIVLVFSFFLHCCFCADRGYNS